MGGLAQAYTEYAERWGSYAIEADWGAYQKETAAIIEALRDRITRENSELYVPVAAALMHAARFHPGAIFDRSVFQ